MITSSPNKNLRREPRTISETMPTTPASPGTAGEGFTNRIRTLIKTYGGVSHIARTCGFSEGVVRSWRDGRSDPSRKRCLALAHGLNISLLWLMTGNGSMLDDSNKYQHGETTSVLDAHRLLAAMQVLHSTLESSGNHLPLQSQARLLSGYYAALSDPDPLMRAVGIGATHQQLLECIRQTHADSQDLASLCDNTNNITA